MKLLATIAAALVPCLVLTNEATQGYDIMIHAIPHTHLDAGWIEDIETYYNNYVVEIFKTLIPELETNPHYRFNWAEVGFLQRWWV